MKAIGFSEHLDIKDPKSLFEFETPKPTPKGHDLLVKVNAVSVNPVDVGVRRSGHGKLSKPKLLAGMLVELLKKLVARYHFFHQVIVFTMPDHLNGQEAIVSIS